MLQVKFEDARFREFLNDWTNGKAMKAGQRAGLEKVRDFIAAYPAQRIGFTRKAAYGVTFFSDAQRGAFFAKLHSGEINVPYRRTGRFAQSMSIQGDTLYSSDPNAKHLVTDRQSRMAKLMGWRNARTLVREEFSAISRAIVEGIRNFLRR